MVIPLQLRCDTSGRLRETGTPYALKAIPAERLPIVTALQDIPIPISLGSL